MQSACSWPHAWLQLLLNIAGVIDGTKASIDSIDAQQMLHCFQTNSIGPLLVTQQLLANGLLKSGSIVANMTSKVGSSPALCAWLHHVRGPFAVPQ